MLLKAGMAPAFLVPASQVRTEEALGTSPFPEPSRCSSFQNMHFLLRDGLTPPSQLLPSAYWAANCSQNRWVATSLGWPWTLTWKQPWVETGWPDR